MTRIVRGTAAVLAVFLYGAPAEARPDHLGGIDLAVDAAPWGLFEFEETIGPSVGVQGAIELGDGFGFGALYRGLGDLGGMAGVFGRLAATPTLMPKKPFLFWTVDAGFVAGVGGLSGAAIYLHGSGQAGYATSERFGFVAGLGLTSFVGAGSTSVSSIQVPVISVGFISRISGAESE